MKLYILGNGFDLAHGLPTNYHDYYDYLVKQEETWFIKMLEYYFGNVPQHPHNILWSQLEKALGIYDVNDIYDYLKEDHTLDEDHVSQYVGEVEAEIQYHFVEICHKFNETYTDWCQSIDLSGITRQKNFSFVDDDLFLSFNYTDTLEKVYGLDDMQILHIHGRASKGDELIVGHNNPAKMPLGIVDDFLDNTANIRAIVDTINNLVKNTGRIIAENNTFFTGLANVDEVVIYGHSIEEVDMPYFEKVKQSVKSNANWKFSYHNENEVGHKNDVAKRLGMGAGHYTLFNV